MNNQPTVTTVYTKGKLQVYSATPNTEFSHLLDALCHTIGAEHKETAYLLKKVNFYKFKAWMQQKNGMHFNWFNWYSENRAQPEFNTAIAEYLNDKENRTAIYVSKDGSKIDRLIYEAIQLTNQMKSINNQL